MLFEGTKLKQPIRVAQLYTIHYYEYDRDFRFDGESHPFWELAYVDRGAAVIARGGEELRLQQGYAVLHEPGVFHCVRSEGAAGLNLIVVSFACEAKELSALARAPFPFFAADKQRLSSILSEARQAFSSPLDSAYFKLRRRAGAPLGAEQLILTDLESLLIHLARRGEARADSDPAAMSGTDQGAEDQLASAIACMRQNLSEPLSIDELCRRCLISRSKLQRLFRQYTGQSALNYYIGLRVDAAKEMMRGRQHSFSEIAAALGFGTIHYFSRLFKQTAGMTPSEYVASLRSLSDRRGC